MGARRGTRAYHHGDLRRSLLDGARALIAAHGAEGFTLREVARRIGVTHAAAYRHFADRRALVAAVAEEGFRRLQARLERARDATPPSLERRLRALLGAYLRFCWQEPSLCAAMFGPRLSRDGEFPTLEAAVSGALGLIVETIEQLAPPGALRASRPRDLAIALWTFVHGFATLSHDKAAYRSAAAAAAAFDRAVTPTLVGMFGGTARAGRRRAAR
jgi:AcrR family transcriptional regulator